MAAPEQTPLLVIGAGPYGLATAAEAGGAASRPSCSASR